MSNINVNNLTPLLGSGSSVSVSGSLVVKNDVTIGGHLYIGDANTDSVTFSAEVSSSVVPDANITYDLGSSAKKWKELYLNSLVVKHITASGNISASGTGVNGTGSFHHMDVNGNITASGTGSFQQGVIANQSSSFTYISMSGALKTAYHVSASKLQLTKTAEIYGSASMGYISSSGDLTASGTGSFGGGIDSSTATGSFGQVTAVGDVSSSGTGSFMDVFIDDNLEVQGDTNLHGNISGSGTATASFGHISASGDISTSTDVHAVQYFTDSLIFATGNQASNTVKLGGGASVTRIHGLSIDVSGSISMSGDMTLTGDISSSGRISASSGFETDAGTTSNFGTISSSGNLIISGDVSASGRISASNGFQAGTLSTSSFGYLSASGTAYFGAATVVINGNAGHITASGNISASGTVYAQSFESPGDVEIDINDSINVAGGITASGNISASGGIHSQTSRTIGNIEVGGEAQFGSTGFQVDPPSTVYVTGDITATTNITASGNISSSGIFQGNSLQLANNGINSLTLHASGLISASSTIAGTALTLATTGTTYATIDALGTGSFLGGIDCIGDGKNATGSFGYISASGDISASGNVYGTHLQASDRVITPTIANGSGDDIVTLGTTPGISVLGASEVIGNLSSSAILFGTALTVTTAGVHKASIDASGNVAAEGTISSSGVMSATALTLTTAGVHKASIDASGNVAAEGNISSSATLAARSLDIKSAGVTLASIDTSGNLDLIAGNEFGATGSFGYISMSGDFSASGNITASGVYADGDISASGAVFTKFIKPNAGATLNITPDTGAAFASDTHTVQIYGGLKAGVNAVTPHLFTGQITSSGTASFAAGIIETGNIHSTGTVYAPFYSNYHAVTNDQILTVTSSGVPIVVTGAVTVVLPAVAIGHSYWIINGNADGTVINISPNANDKFIINAAGAAGTDDKDLILTAGTAETGDYIKVSYASGDGWIINERAGTWADES